MGIKYIKNGPLNAKEIIDVFQDVEWNKNEDNIVDAFSHSFYIMAYDNEKLVGLARAISDGYYYTGIYDVVVRNHYQKQGIGKTLVNSLKEEFKGTMIFLTYTEGKSGFYHKLGFIDQPRAMWIDR